MTPDIKHAEKEGRIHILYPHTKQSSHRKKNPPKTGWPTTHLVPITSRPYCLETQMQRHFLMNGRHVVGCGQQSRCLGVPVPPIVPWRVYLRASTKKNVRDTAGEGISPRRDPYHIHTNTPYSKCSIQASGHTNRRGDFDPIRRTHLLTNSTHQIISPTDPPPPISISPSLLSQYYARSGDTHLS